MARLAQSSRLSTTPSARFDLTPLQYTIVKHEKCPGFV
jgi:hypothetical protein